MIWLKPLVFLVISVKVGISRNWLLSIDGASIKALNESLTLPLTEFSLNELKVVVTLIATLLYYSYLFLISLLLGR